MVLVGPEGHGGLTGVTDQGDHVRVERAVTKGSYSEVLDVRGDDVVVVDEASAARCGAAEDADACVEPGGGVGAAVDEAGAEAGGHLAEASISIAVADWGAWIALGAL